MYARLPRSKFSFYCHMCKYSVNAVLQLKKFKVCPSIHPLECEIVQKLLFRELQKFVLKWKSKVEEIITLSILHIGVLNTLQSWSWGCSCIVMCVYMYVCVYLCWAISWTKESRKMPDVERGVIRMLLLEVDTLNMLFALVIELEYHVQ